MSSSNKEQRHSKLHLLERQSTKPMSQNDPAPTPYHSTRVHGDVAGQPVKAFRQVNQQIKLLVPVQVLAEEKT